MDSSNARAVDGKPTTFITLSEKAYGFLNSIKELGLVDDEMEDEILNRLMMMVDAEIGIEDMKRVSAIVIFERQFDANEDYYGIFEEEWKLLFN